MKQQLRMSGHTCYFFHVLPTIASPCDGTHQDELIFSKFITFDQKAGTVWLVAGKTM